MSALAKDQKRALICFELLFRDFSRADSAILDIFRKSIDNFYSMCYGIEP